MKRTYLFNFKLFLFLYLIIYSSAYSQLSGIYTVGPGKNFPTITSAVNSLVTNGVNGPVEFSLTSSYYNEAVTIDSVPGASAINNITFRSETYWTGSVAWANENPAIPYIIRINGADFLNIIYMTLSNSPDSSSMILIEGNVEHLTISRLQFGSIFWTSDHGIKSIFSNNAVTSDLLIDQNDLEPYPIILNSNIKRSVRSVLRYNNLFPTFGMKISDQDDLLFEHNIVQYITPVSTTVSCVAFNNCGGNMRISKNSFFTQTDNNDTLTKAVVFENCNPDSGLISNNYISLCFGEGLKISNCSNLKIYNNTIKSLTSECMNLIVNNSTGIILKNNLSSALNAAGKMCSVINSSLVSEYNNFQYVFPNFGFYNSLPVSDIDHWREISGTDVKSTNDSVQFTSNISLNMNNESVNNLNLIGIPISVITTDRADRPRNPVFPYKGASEPQFNVNATVDFKMLIEGFYNDVTGLMIRDSVKAYLRNINSPYNIIDSSKTILRNDGTAPLRFYNAASGTYYITVKHRNSIETWSTSGGEIISRGSMIPFDFTGSASQAFGNNLKLKGSKYCIFSGDVNQEGNINLTDVIAVYNNSANFISGYKVTDVNGDNFTDLTDVIITYTNSINFVRRIIP